MAGIMFGGVVAAGAVVAYKVWG